VFGVRDELKDFDDEYQFIVDIACSRVMMPLEERWCFGVMDVYERLMLS
jgi:hypothetical protein